MQSNIHIPVLLKESINILNINPNGIYVDATAGMGGHSQKILDFLDKGKLICIDQDQFAINQLETRFGTIKNVSIIKDNFIHIDKILKKLNVTNVDGILADLGVSSPMFDNSDRGFSYKDSNQLDMRMDTDNKVSAWTIVNKYPLQKLIKIFKKYGEAKNSKQVAFNICKYRKNKTIDTTEELVNIIKDSISKKFIYKAKHPAKIYFQAIRIAVNDELNNLTTFINKSTNLLNKDGILVIISYHSLEDRIIKQSFNKLTSPQIPKEIPIQNIPINYELINKHPIIPTEDEIKNNHRAHSAKLRAIRKVNYV